MNRAGTVTTLDPEAIRSMREAERDRLREDASEAGSPYLAIAKKHRRLAMVTPRDLPLDAFVEHGTPIWYADADARLAECEKCPSFGGACAETGLAGQCFYPGEIPVWRGDRIEKAPCDKFEEWKLRERLKVVGLPALYHDRAFAGWEERNDAAGAACASMVRVMEQIVESKGQRGSLLLSGERGTGKTHLAAALLRNLIRKAPRLRLGYSSLPSIRIPLKNWKFGSDDPDPMAPLRRAHVLVFEDVDPRALGEEWLRERVEDLLRERFLAMRPTIVTTHVSSEALAKAMPSLTMLAQVPACVVS